MAFTSHRTRTNDLDVLVDAIQVGNGAGGFRVTPRSMRNG